MLNEEKEQMNTMESEESKLLGRTLRDQPIWSGEDPQEDGLKAAKGALLFNGRAWLW